LGDAKGFYLSDNPQRIISPIFNRYLAIRLHRDGKRFSFHIHRLVLCVFKGTCPDGLQACHNDGNKYNPCLTNLRWDTPKNNQADRIKHGNPPKGEGNPNSKLTLEDVINIKNLFSTGLTRKAIAQKYGVCASAIGRIISGKAWLHI
jgi:hypothetical protein